MNIKKTKKIILALLCVLILSSIMFQGFYEGLYAPTFNPHLNFTEDNIVFPEAKVAIVKSERENASDITADEIESLVRQAVELAGGLDYLITDGDVVVLKPNLISDYDQTFNPQTLPAEVNGITTDYRLTQAVVNIVRELNPNGTVYILEGVANGTTSGNMATLRYNTNRINGVDDFLCLEEVSGGWREYNSDNLVGVTLPRNQQLYADNLKPNNSPEYYLNKIYYEADVLISLPVLKNHSLSNVTGAVKNVGIGATPQNIYGGAPGDNHRFINNVIDHYPTSLHQWIHDFYLCRPVDFAIMDGLQGSLNGPVGQGSANLTDAQQNMRLILAGKDAIAVDAIASLIMSYDPEKVRHLVHLHNSLVGCADPALIRVLGANIPDLKKMFFNSYSEDINGWYWDSTPPNAIVNSAYATENELFLDLAVDAETVKIEVAVDGIFLEEIAISEFNNIRFGLDNIPAGEHSYSVYVYDHFLNQSETVLNLVTSVDGQGENIPESLELYQNYPNPFNPYTTISYNISEPGNVKLAVYDIIGDRICTIVDEYKSSGFYSEIFDATNHSSGIYFYRLEIAGCMKTKQMLLIK